MEQAGAILSSQGMAQADIAEAVGKSLRTVERWHAKPAFQALVTSRVSKAIEPTTALLDAQRTLVDVGAPQAAKVILNVAHQTRPVNDDIPHGDPGSNCILDAHAGVCREPTGAAVNAAELIAKGTGLFVSEKQQVQAAAAVIIVTPADIAAARRDYIDIEPVEVST